MLVLDAGGSLMGAWASLVSDGQVTVEAMNAMGYDALAIGSMELLKGLDVLQARADEAQFLFLSANLMPIGGVEPLFSPYTIITRDGLLFGILGLTEPEALQHRTLADVVEVADPLEVAARYVPELAEQVDLLIVLSHLGIEADRALANAVPGIDIIVGGNSRLLMNAPESVGTTLIIQQGYLGEYLGGLSVRYDSDGNAVSIDTKRIILGPEMPDDPELADLMARVHATYPTPTPIPTRTP